MPRTGKGNIHPIISGGRDMTRFNSGSWTGGGFKDASGKIVGGSTKITKNIGGFKDPSGKIVGGSTTKRVFTNK